MENKKRFLQGALCGALVTFLVIVAGTVGLKYYEKSVNTTSAQMDRKIKLIDAFLDRYYLYEDDLKQEKMTEGAYAGYVNALDDPYTVYYSKEEAKKLQESLSGEYSGIGAVLSQDYSTNAVTITSVYEDSPAEKAGLKAGDLLYQVDEKQIADQKLSEIVTWIHGEKGTEVTLHVIREGEDVSCTAIRDVLEVKTVQYKMVEDRIGYISVSEFDSVTYQQFKNALEDLQKQGMEGLIIDLRSNPGGNLGVVLDMLQMILPEGTIVSTKDKDGKVTDFPCAGETPFDKPMAVLVNGYSASASEIFAGAVQDYGVAKIVGTTTYGKGVVQNLIDLKDGSELKVTVAEYFLPSGRSINKKGITPDVEVEYEKSEDNPEYDNQLETAIDTLQQEQ